MEIENNFIIREIDISDYDNGYLDVMIEFSKTKFDITREQFNDYLNQYKNTVKIIVVLSKNDNKVIGAGSIFKLDKLHYNPVGQIEDVVIDEKWRKYGLGKKLIEELVEIGLNEFKCYKVILNCLDHNIGFYNKCNFNNTGNQMRYNI